MLKRLFGRGRKPPAPSDAPAPVVHTVDVTDATFTAALHAPGLTVVDFWADWCQPCEVMSAFVEFLARDFAGRLHVLALDTEANPRVTEAYNILGLPTLIYFRDSAEVHRTTGVTTYDDLRRVTQRLLQEG